MQSDKENFIQAIKELKKIFDSAGVEYWLSFGTLLGAIREGKFIGWDNDLDFGARLSEVGKVFSVIPELAKRGWRVDVTDSTVSMSKNNVGVDFAFYRITDNKAWILFLRGKPRFDFILKYFDRIAERAHYRKFHKGLHSLESGLYRIIPPFMDSFLRKLFFGVCYLFGQQDHAMVLPEESIRKMKKTLFYGMEFFVPNPPEAYLSLIYGETWRVPNPKWKWEDVVSMDYEFFKRYKRYEYSLLQ